jgi:hypothetical protein
LVQAFDGENPSREESAMADDVCDILADGLRAGSGETGGGDAGGVEDYQTTREQEEAQRTEREFFQAIGGKLRARCGDWANGRKGLAIGELGTRDGWRFGLLDMDGRLFEIEVRYSEIAAVAAMQRTDALSNFEHTLDRIVAKFQEARRIYLARRDGVTLS